MGAEEIGGTSSVIDVEGHYEQEPCPKCGSTHTISYHYPEGFTELSCRRCGFRSDAEELAALQRYRGDVLEGVSPDGAGSSDDDVLWHPSQQPLKA